MLKDRDIDNTHMDIDGTQDTQESQAGMGGKGEDMQIRKLT
jgi:hypothetical protein